MASEPADERPAWVEALLGEIRRAGRAAVSAQAAAEACEEQVEQLARQPDARSRRSEEAEGLLRALLPALDALDRIAAEARRPRPPHEPKRWLHRLLQPRRTATPERDLQALREAVTLLQAQITGALESRGVAIDRETGGPVEPARHRVVATRPDARSSGTVLEVVRPGYTYAGTRLREADVVAAARVDPD